MMSVKKLINIFVPLKAVSPRNFTSLTLVAIFFAIYVLSGGKIQSVPKVEQGDAFGGARGSGKIAVTGDVVKPAAPNRPSAAQQPAAGWRTRDNQNAPSEEEQPAEAGAEASDSTFANFQDRINRIGRKDEDQAPQ